MTINESIALFLAALAGGGLGVLFFGGLLWTVRKGLSSARPALWFLGSLLLRTVLTLAGFYVVSAGHWQRLLACLLGFVIARLVVTWMTRPSLTNNPHVEQEVRHAPQS